MLRGGRADGLRSAPHVLWIVGSRRWDVERDVKTWFLSGLVASTMGEDLEDEEAVAIVFMLAGMDGGNESCGCASCFKAAKAALEHIARKIDRKAAADHRETVKGEWTGLVHEGEDEMTGRRTSVIVLA